jgi:hypothetical protein
MGAVTQVWTHELTLMQQSVLLGSVRGPDGLPKYGAIKMLLRFYRRAILTSSFKGVAIDNPYDTDGGSFYGPSIGAPVEFDAWEAPMDEVLSDYLRDLDAVPHHFQLHFIHAVEIVGYKHPNKRVRAWWRRAYERLVHDMHLWPESEDELDRRLGDSREGWLQRADPATVA